jgi:hypothetical protein
MKSISSLVMVGLLVFSPLATQCGGEEAAIPSYNFKGIPSLDDILSALSFNTSGATTAQSRFSHYVGKLSNKLNSLIPEGVKNLDPKVKIGITVVGSAALVGAAVKWYNRKKHDQVPHQPRDPQNHEQFYN